MPKIISGTFMTPASGDIYLCIGFIPDWVKVYQSNANEEYAFWSINLQRGANAISGWTIDDDGAVSVEAVDTGIQIYRGGHLVTAAEATAGTYLVDARKDYRQADNAGPTYSTIDTWTLDSGYTGHWNAGCNTTYIGVGSRIKIGDRWYVITGLSNDGDASTEVTLSETGVASGDIQFIGPMYDYMSASANQITRPGFWIDSTSDVLNATSEIAMFEAGCYD